MLSQDLKEHLEDQIGEKIKNHQSVSGGDISLAYQIQSESKRLFLKVNANKAAQHMFQMEEIGLRTIKNSLAIKAPNTHAVGQYHNKSFLIMDWIDTKSPSSQNMELFGKQLATMHLTTNETFGFEDDNYIGNLPQSNNKHDNWLDFYIEERLQPQLELSIGKELLKPDEVPSIEQMKDTCFHLFEKVKPSLLHGDLWSGNYLISATEEPYLIDPAVYFGHNEVDIAMTKLFGGFSNSFYKTYHKIIPQDDHSSTRIELYQLYYLLVHLNLFGKSYYRSVINILNNIFA